MDNLRQREIDETKEFFANIGLSPALQGKRRKRIAKDKDRWVDFMMKYELGLDKPDPKRATKSALNIGLSYIAEASSLSVHIFVASSTEALTLFSRCTLICLFVFGWFKSRISGYQCLVRDDTGNPDRGLAAGAAFGVAKPFE